MNSSPYTSVCLECLSCADEAYSSSTQSLKISSCFEVWSVSLEKKKDPEEAAANQWPGSQIIWPPCGCSHSLTTFFIFFSSLFSFSVFAVCNSLSSQLGYFVKWKASHCCQENDVFLKMIFFFLPSLFLPLLIICCSSALTCKCLSS